MDHFHKLRSQVQNYIFLIGMITVMLMVGGSWVARQIFPHHDTLISLVLLVVGGIAVWVVSMLLTNYALKPLDTVWRAILHVTPGHTNTTPPDLDKNVIGQELVKTLALQVYQLASDSQAKTGAATPASKPTNPMVEGISRDLPLPVFAVTKDQLISFANEAGLKYLGLTAQDVLQKNLYSVFDMSFTDENTLDKWLQDCRANKALDQHAWRRVRLRLANQTTIKQFDLAASYSKGNPNGVEVILALFDETSQYQGDDQALDFIALAVHELRTPLTSLRGYIEVFEDELGSQLNAEQADFMSKMQASAEQLTAFVGNILNVARIQEGQLTLQLTEGNWPEIIKAGANNFSLPAKLRGITISYTIEANVPTVAVDKVSIAEVINNLLDNALKYSGQGKLIAIHTSVNNQGLVETTVQDHGLGIPSGVMPTLFEKFHRNHRNQSKIGGTGLGLYLCSQLIKAHGGNIWLDSKEGQGTTVSFTLQPYSQLAEKLKAGDNKDITRNAHGWIKNHSLYRR